MMEPAGWFEWAFSGVIWSLGASIASYWPFGGATQNAWIITRSENDDCQWLVNLLRLEDFKDYVTDVKHCLYHQDPQKLIQDASSISHVILYKSRELDDDNKHLDLVELAKEFYDQDKKNCIIVFGDLDEKECEKDKFSKTATPDFCNKLILYTKSDIKLLKEKVPLFQKAKEKLKDMEKIMKTSQESPGYVLSYIMDSPKHTVGIFSRSSEEEYSWLQTQLRSNGFRDCVQEVRPCYISNSRYREFTQDVSQCTFGILYHTKNRGRINITDVTDSLYDKELEYLSEKLGKERVIVLVDDVEQDPSGVRSRILENQRSIGNLSEELFVFTNEEKVICEKLQVLEAWIKYDKQTTEEAIEVPATV